MRPLKNFDYSRYPNMPQNRVAFEDLEVGVTYEATVVRPGGKQLVTYLGNGQYQCGDAVYSDWELDEAMSLVIPIRRINENQGV